MADFPTLSSYAIPEVNAWQESKAFDPTIRSPQEAGYILTKARFTRIPKKWHISYETLQNDDKISLENFETARKVGAESFNWTNPKNSIVYVVRFLAPISFGFNSQSSMYWKAEFDLEEV